jgi:hypothetical protein
MSKVFITFGAGSQGYLAAVSRLTDQVAQLGLFDRIIGFTDKDLKADVEFWNKHGIFIEENKRGYGYWIWKPYLIEKTMKTLADGDLLLYLDAGCEVDARKRPEMVRAFEIAKRDLILGTWTQREGAWTKMDVIQKLRVQETRYLNTGQRQSTANLFLVEKRTRALVSKWYELACDYHMIDDSPSKIPNTPDYREHRHDQSLFSLLSKKANLYSLRNTLHMAVATSRNRTGQTQIMPAAAAAAATP